MTQLTGIQLGTPQADTLSGVDQQTASVGSLQGTGILDATLYALAGEDLIAGLASVRVDAGDAQAYGVVTSNFYAGTGDDMLTLSGNAEGGTIPNCCRY